MVLPDAVIESIIQAVRRITSRYSLEKELQAAHFDVGSSLMPCHLVPLLYQLIDDVLRSNDHLETRIEPSIIPPQRPSLVLTADQQTHTSPRRGRRQPTATAQHSPQRRVVHIARSPRKAGFSPTKTATKHKRQLSRSTLSPSKPGLVNKRRR